MTDIEVDLIDELKTCFQMVILNLSLTENGVLNYQKVLTVVFEYFRLLGTYKAMPSY